MEEKGGISVFVKNDPFFISCGEVSRNELAKEALFGFHRKTITAFGNYATKLLGSFESEELAAKKYAGKLINIQDKLKNTNVAELCRPQ